MTKHQHKPVQLTLAHINDTHSYFEPQSLQLELQVEQQTVTPYVSNGGFARIATRAKWLRQQAKMDGREFLFFHAGDCFQGTLYFSLFKGVANAELLNALNIDAMALGNHELDMGNQPVADFLGRINFPLLAGNWDISTENPDKPHKLSSYSHLLCYNAAKQTANYMIKQVDGEPIAIFGVSMDLMSEISNPDPDTSFKDVFRTVKNTIEEIQANDINKIIIISHLGYDVDIKLAESVEGVAIIIGGHSHTLMGDFSSIGFEPQPDYGIEINGTHVVQAGYHAQAIGHCQIDFARDGRVTSFNGRNELLIGRRLCLDATLSSVHDQSIHSKATEALLANDNIVVCKKDSDVQEILLDKYIPIVRQLQQTTIAEIDKPLRHVRIPDQSGGSDLVPLVAESFHYMMKSKGHAVQFAIHNAGGIRSSLNPGKITEADIAGKVLPFAVPIGVYQIKGRYLAEAIEGAINNATNNGVVGTGSGSYPYCHNLDFSYHPERPIGQRLTDFMIFDDAGGWVSVQPERIYTGTSSAYTMKGKEGYFAITHMLDNAVVTNYSMADCFVAFIKSHPEKLNQLPNNEVGQTG